ncbi:MAG: hypothetical protein K2J72_06690, partial [Oscillospiraceae bacterium]|nr:hypothetical protein [Oscillospiraceae bacterium]
MFKKLIPVLAAMLLFSGCQNTDSNPAAENEPASVTAAEEQTEANVLLPDGLTMDDLRNLLVIN